MKKIIFVDHADFLGGGEYSLLSILRHIDRERFRIAFAGCGAPLCAAGALGIETFELYLSKLQSIFFPFRLLEGSAALRTIIREFEPDVVYANTQRAALYCPGVFGRRGAKLVVHLRDAKLFISTERVLDSADLVIVPSKFIRDTLCLGPRARVIPSGIETEEIAEAGAGEWPEKLGKPLVLSAGRMLAWKRHTLFFEVARRVRAQMPNVHFALAGGPLGSQREADCFEHLQQLAAASGVTLTGHLPSIAPLLKAADVFVCCSKNEPFGRVLAEAMAAGLPVVAFASGSTPEVLANGAGVLVPDEHGADAMAAAICQLLARPNLKESLRARALARSRAFDARVTTRQIEEALASLW